MDIEKSLKNFSEKIKDALRAEAAKEDQEAKSWKHRGNADDYRLGEAEGVSNGMWRARNIVDDVLAEFIEKTPHSDDK